MSFQSTASSSAKSGSFGSGGSNALVEGDWIVSTGSATGSSVPAMAIASAGKPIVTVLVAAALIAGAAWFLHKHKV